MLFRSVTTLKVGKKTFLNFNLDGLEQLGRNFQFPICKKLMKENNIHIVLNQFDSTLVFQAVLGMCEILFNK